MSRQITNKKGGFGTKEWANSNVNIYYGCSNQCKYCYAQHMAKRFNRLYGINWGTMIPIEKKIKKRYMKRKGRIMFPSSHDITKETLENSLIVLKKLLYVGNEVLITSKPDPFCIDRICNEFVNYKDQIQFRFTITSIDNNILRFWEPYAPSLEERIEALKIAYKKGFKTSVSIEPFLDEDPSNLVSLIEPFITESIWVGKMNYIKRTKNLEPSEIPEYKRIRWISRKKNLILIYYRLKEHPKIRWKDSIRNILFKEGVL